MTVEVVLVHVRQRLGSEPRGESRRPRCVHQDDLVTHGDAREREPKTSRSTGINVDLGTKAQRKNRVTIAHGPGLHGFGREWSQAQVARAREKVFVIENIYGYVRCCDHPNLDSRPPLKPPSTPQPVSSPEPRSCSMTALGRDSPLPFSSVSPASMIDILRQVVH